MYCTEILYSPVQMFVVAEIKLFAQPQQSCEHFVNYWNLLHIKFLKADDPDENFLLSCLRRRSRLSGCAKGKIYTILGIKQAFDLIIFSFLIKFEKRGGDILAGCHFFTFEFLICEQTLAEKYDNWNKSKEDEGIRNILLASLEDIEERVTYRWVSKMIFGIQLHLTIARW